MNYLLYTAGCYVLMQGSGYVASADLVVKYIVYINLLITVGAM